MKKLVLIVLLLMCSGSAYAADWEKFKSRFIRPDGSVIDVQNHNRSHSEGQGYGMLLAVRYNDRETFDRVHNWAVNVLGKGLKAWLAEPYEGGYKILDHNSATDGDILIAYALLRAAEVWNDPSYRNTALKNIALIRKEAVKDYLILPGKKYFTFGSEIVINPSYFIFPAIEYFSMYDDADFWGAVYEKCLMFIGRVLQAPLQVPPDWIVYDPKQNEFRPYRIEPFLFGYNAIRVPLYLGMASELSTLALMDPMMNWIKENRRMPEYIYMDPFGISKDSGNAGFYAVASYWAAVMNDLKTAEFLFAIAKEKIEHEKNNYYSNVLFLLAWPNQ